MEKIDKIVLLDTDVFIDYMNGSNIDLFIDVFNTSKAFEAPVTISIFSLYELLKNKNEKQVRENLNKIDGVLGGMMHVRGIGDKLMDKTDPSYWIKCEEFDFVEFKTFYEDLKLEVMRTISKYLTRYYAFVIYCSLLFEAIEKNKNGQTLSFFTSVMKNKDVIKEIDELIFNLIKTDSFIDLSDSKKYEKIYHLLICFIKSLNSLFDESIEITPVLLLSRNRIVKIMKLIKNGNTNDLIEIRKLVNTSAYDKFLDSIFHRLYAKDEMKTLDDYMIKNIILRVPYNNGKFDLNDWIDMLNLSFVVNTNDAYVIYATKDTQWRKFIDDYKYKFPKLEQCIIIGDEGYLTKKV